MNFQYVPVARPPEIRSNDGSVALLYPPVAGEQQALASGKILQKTIEMYVPEDRDAVVDVLKVIATTRSINPSVFPQGSIRKAPPVNTRTLQGPLTQFLGNAMRGTRAAKPVEVKTWTTRQRAVRVRRESTNLTGFSLYFEEGQEA